jgi:hypothetical protein
MAACLFAAAGVQAQSTVLYETQFEAAEGYNRDLDLAGQRGWVMEGSGGNGLLDEYFEGFGQQAYIGFTPPESGVVTALWRPVNFTPPASNSIVTFSVKMQVVQSTTGGDDDFRWAVYNSEGDRLFGINFETATQEIWFQNEDLEFQSTGWSFDFEGTYDLQVWMDFTRNSWTALLNDIVLVNGQPISTTNTTPLNLGDVDAVWFINNASGVGNNYMLFDNYRITAENLKAIPGRLEPTGRTPEGYFRFMIHGQPDVRYAVEVTTDFEEWFTLGEYSDPNGTFLFEDDTAGEFQYGFYRLRALIP